MTAPYTGPVGPWAQRVAVRDQDHNPTVIAVAWVVAVLTGADTALVLGRDHRRSIAPESDSPAGA